MKRTGAIDLSGGHGDVPTSESVSPVAPIQLDVDGIQDALNQLGASGGSVRVWLKSPRKTKPGHVLTVPVEDFNVESIKSTYGGGTYTFQFCESNGRIAQKVVWEVDERIRGSIDAPIPTPVMTNLPAPVIPLADNTPLLAVLGMMQQSAQQQMTLLVEMMRQQSATTVAMLQGMRGDKSPAEPLAPLMTALSPLLLRATEPTKVQSLDDIIKTMGALKAVMGNVPLPAGDSPAPEKDMLEKVGDLLQGIAPVLGPIVQGLMNRRQQFVQVPSTPMNPPHIAPPRTVTPADTSTASTPPSPSADSVVNVSQSVPVPVPPQASAQAPAQALELAHAPANVPSPTPTEESVANLIAQLRMVAPLLFQAADNGTPAETYVDLLHDALDPAGLDVLREILTRPDWVYVLFAESRPAVQERQAWFDALRSAILESLKSETVEIPQESLTPGQASPGTVYPVPPGIL